MSTVMIWVCLCHNTKDLKSLQVEPLNTAQTSLKFKKKEKRKKESVHVHDKMRPPKHRELN